MKNKKTLTLIVGAIILILAGVAVWAVLGNNSAENTEVEGYVTAVGGDRITIQSGDTTFVIVVTDQTVRPGSEWGGSAAFDIGDVEIGNWFVVVKGIALDDGTIRATRVVMH